MQVDSQTKSSSASKGRELVILSGKGGTGKTSVAGGFSYLAQKAVLCDCDVDAANLALLLNPRNTKTYPFYASKKAYIDPSICSNCGKCFETCRFGAIVKNDDGTFQSIELLCEGCGFCFHVCPENAITMKDALSGHWYISETDHGPFIHARLEPAEGNSGKLVSAVRIKGKEIQRKKNKDIIITDGPPGTGCPVIACVTGADLALIVTEPTLSGISDLERIIDVCHHFQVSVLICINKYDIDLENTQTIKDIAERMDCDLAGEIPYDHAVPKAMVNGVPATDYDCEAGKAIRRLWEIVSARLVE